VTTTASKTRYLRTDWMLGRWGWLAQLAMVNATFGLYGLLFCYYRGTETPWLTLGLHAVVVVILFILPGLLTALCIRRSFDDLVHLWLCTSMLSAASVLCVKLVLNAFQVSLSALTFSLAILGYCNLCIVLQGIRYRWATRQEATRQASEEKDAARRTPTPWLPGLACSLVLVVLFVLLERTSIRIDPVPDIDRVTFGTYSLMTKSIPGAGYFEPSRTEVYADYTPFLKYDFSHPPLAVFNCAYASTLCGYLDYSKALARQMEADKHAPSMRYGDLRPDKGYLACNRAPTNYHIVVLCALVYLFALRLVGRPWLALGAMVLLVGLFWDRESYAIWFLSCYKALFIAYSLGLLYVWLYMKERRWLSFFVGLCGALVSQKVVYVLPAVLVMEAFERRWRALLSPGILGFIVGTLAFIIYGMLIDSRVFVSMYFVLHFCDRLAGAEGMWARVGKQWLGFALGTGGLVIFPLLVWLTVAFARRHWRDREFVLLLYLISSAGLASRIWPYSQRFLVPTLFPMVLMSARVLSEWFDRLARTRRPGRSAGREASWMSRVLRRGRS